MEQLKNSQFGELPFTQEEKEEIQNLLEKKLNNDEITYRQGPSGRKHI